jgi:hypothetical protein
MINPAQMAALHEDILYRGSQSVEWDGMPPLLRLSYSYKYPFNTMATAYLKKYNWEPNT